jgi:hypothetical protein
MWTQYFKLNQDRIPCQAQMSYEPLINKERNVFCMNYDPTNSYQDYMNRLGFIPEMVHELFEREVKYLTKFQNYKWAPELLDVKDKKVYIRWYDNTCNDLIFSGQALPTDWKQQLKTAIDDQLSERVYKITQYPHCFFVDDKDTLRTFDFYGCCDFDNDMVPYSKIKGMMVGRSAVRIEEAQDGELVSMGKIFLNSLKTHIKWPDDYLTEVYKTVNV